VKATGEVGNWNRLRGDSMLEASFSMVHWRGQELSHRSDGCQNVAASSTINYHPWSPVMHHWGMITYNARTIIDNPQLPRKVGYHAAIAPAISLATSVTRKKA
jgi:hypothetical protein